MEEDSVDVICAQCQKLIFGSQRYISYEQFEPILCQTSLLTHLYYLVLFYQPLKYWLRNPTVKPWTAGLLA